MNRILVFLLLFVSFVVYSFFVYTTGTQNVAAGMNSEAIAGKFLYQKHNCTSCHQLYGLGGFLGPELTTIVSQESRREMYARVILKSGTQRMPDFHLSEEEINCLIEYLKYIEATAITYK